MRLPRSRPCCQCFGQRAGFLSVGTTAAATRTTRAFFEDSRAPRRHPVPRRPEAVAGRLPSGPDEPITTTDLPFVCHRCRFVFRTSKVISPTQNPEPIKPVPPTTTTVYVGAKHARVSALQRELRTDTV